MIVDVRNFLEIEKKYNLYDLKIQNTYIWYYLRNDIWQNYICKEKLNLENAHNGSIRNNLMQYIKMIYNALFKGWCINRQADIVVFCSPQRTLEENEYRCRYTDSLIELLPKCIAFENPLWRTHKTPARTRKIIYTDYIFVLSKTGVILTKKILRQKYQMILNDCREKLCKPINEISNQYKVSLDINAFSIQAADLIVRNSMFSFYLNRLFKRCRAKVIIEICSYDNTNMLINEIANDMGIKTIELQHGEMSTDVIAYQYGADKINFGGLPDYIFLFSEYWGNVAHMPLNNVRMVSTGFPYYEEQVKKYKTRSIRTDPRITILFLSQGTIGKKLSRLAVEVDKLLDKKQYRLIYKLHPGEVPIWEESFSWLKSSDIEVVADMKHSIYEYFAISDYQVGVYSTAIYEGLGFGVETFIYNIAHADLMAEMVIRGYAKLFNNCDELVRSIRECNEIDDLKKKNNQTGRGKEFWKSNALENMIGAVNGVLEA